MKKDIKLKLIVNIDYWDRYTEDWDITRNEAKETKENGNWYIHTNQYIADTLISNQIVELVNN